MPLESQIPHDRRKSRNYCRAAANHTAREIPSRRHFSFLWYCMLLYTMSGRSSQRAYVLQLWSRWNSNCCQGLALAGRSLRDVNKESRYKAEILIPFVGSQVVYVCAKVVPISVKVIPRIRTAWVRMIWGSEECAKELKDYSEQREIAR